MPWPEMLTAWAVFGANILSPGPNVFNTIAIALGSGRRSVLAVVPAILIGVWIWAAAALLGAAALFSRWPSARDALAAIGGCLLLVFAVRYARRALAWSADAPLKGHEMSPRRIFLTTLAILATNPKALTTWIVLIGIFPAGEAGGAALATMILGSGLVAAAGHAAYGLVFSTRPAAAAYARAGGWINAGVAVFFASLGASLVIGAIPHILG